MRNVKQKSEPRAVIVNGMLNVKKIPKEDLRLIAESIIAIIETKLAAKPP